MNQQPLTTDLIADPSLWRLSLLIDENRLDVVLYSNVEDNSLIWRSYDLDTSGRSAVEALQEAVYDNPLLLADFARVDVVLATPRFTIVPSTVAEEAVHRAIMSELYPVEGDIDSVIANHLGDLGATILMAPEPGMTGFIRRTFNNPPIHHALEPLCRYFSAKSRYGNARKMYAHFRADRVSVIAFSDDGLRLANTFRYRDPMDAVYYILALRRQLDIEPTDDEMLLSGDSSVREKVMPLLREYHSFVMPVIFPSAMFKAGKDSLNAPFELIVLPLCE